MQMVFNVLMFFDSVALHSFDRGVTWSSPTGLTGDVCAMSAFTSGIGLAVTYSSDMIARCYFSVSGTSWTQFDSLPGISRPIQIATIGHTWYLATTGPKVYVFGQKLDSVLIPGNPVVIDLVARGTDLIATTDLGVFYSKDAGNQWKKIVADGLGPMFVHNTNVLCVSTNGVKHINIDADNIEQVGTWDLPTAPPLTLDIDSYLGSLYTLTHGGTYQMYRLEGDTTWVEVAYPLPGTTAQVSPSLMAIDAGTVVVSHQLVGEFTDSAGVYSYDLNDFTSVDDYGTEITTGGSIINVRLADGGISLSSDRDQKAELTIFDVMGRIVITKKLQTTKDAFIQLPSDLRGFFGVVVTYDDNFVQRGHFLY